MNEALLLPDVQAFIHQHEQDDERELVLKHRDVHGVPIALIAQQIHGRRKSKEKLPELYAASNILYPPTINLEQCSSSATARWKNKLFEHPPSTIVDLTGGFGIDTFFFSQVARHVIYVEPDPWLLDIARHNHQQLGAKNIEYITSTAEAFLSDTASLCDCMYIDPSRRDTRSRKVFKLSECTPDVTLLQEKIFQRSPRLLIKTSPLLDLHQGLRDLKHVGAVVVLSVENDCKEILFDCRANVTGEPIINAVNLRKNDLQEFQFTFSEERQAGAVYHAPLRYLYEPNASILKAGGFKSVAERFDLKKLHASTHLYTSDNFISTFPGRVFEIKSLLSNDEKLVRADFPDHKANVLVRNYPATPDELKKKFKLKDGSDEYFIAFTGPHEKYRVHAARIR